LSCQCAVRDCRAHGALCAILWPARGLCICHAATLTLCHPAYPATRIVIFALLAVLALIWATRSIRQAAMWRPLVICGMPTRWYFTGREHA
jgi:hypothetical protein